MTDQPMIDDDGYPTEALLRKIRDWPWQKGWYVLLEFIRPYWEFADCGYWNSATLGNQIEYYLSTGGWSGNEDIITALEENKAFWSMCWKSSRRGGHYVFTVKK